MKIIDMHTHIYPDAIATKAARSIRNYYHLGENMDGTISTLLEHGSAAGVVHWLILPVAVKPDHVRNINLFTLQQTREHSCFTGFGAIHAGMDPICNSCGKPLNDSSFTYTWFSHKTRIILGSST